MTRFSEALEIAARFIHDLPPELSEGLIVVRDKAGMIRVAIDLPAAEAAAREEALRPLWPRLGVYGSYAGKQVLGREDFLLPELVFSDNPDLVDYQLPGTDIVIKLLERQPTGLDWGRTIPPGEHRSQRILFYGIKGGVGRSTALALTAFRYAAKGKRVLVVDLDLESPGLSSILLPPDRLPEYGIVDWFIEGAAGQGAGLAPRMTAPCELAGSPGGGELRVVPAYGMQESGYLPKLARIYGNATRDGGVERFDERVRRLHDELEAAYEPDLVLIDSRAGLHDLAAVGITSLADAVLLFATNASQTWEGYKLLFRQWQSTPRPLESIRDKLAMVYALLPERNQVELLDSFVERSYDLFSSTIYQQVQAPQGAEEAAAQLEAFNFPQESTLAPHYPALIKWNAAFLDFSAELITRNILDRPAIDAYFGGLFSRLDAILGEDE